MKRKREFRKEETFQLENKNNYYIIINPLLLFPRFSDTPPQQYLVDFQYSECTDQHILSCTKD